MSDFHVIGDCDACIHKTVCKYITDREETISQIRGKLDNIGYDAEDMFIFKTECKGFYCERLVR